MTLPAAALVTPPDRLAARRFIEAQGLQFEDAFDDCKGGVPEEPFDMSEWYSKGLAKEHEERYPGSISIDELKAVQREARRADR